MDYTSMKMLDVCKLEGVKDILPLSARGKFAQALIAEAKGDSFKAADLLNQAMDLAK